MAITLYNAVEYYIIFNIDRLYYLNYLFKMIVIMDENKDAYFINKCIYSP